MEAQQSVSEPSGSWERESTGIEPFRATLARRGLHLERGKTTTLQINVGLLCNQACRHCHLSAGPQRTEVMTLETAHDVIAYAARARFDVVDITGGAPELNPHVETLIEHLSPLTSRLMLRSNLSVLNGGTRDHFTELLRKHRVVIVASFPSLNETQTDSQRGKGVFKTSVDALRRLNEMGYGVEHSGLELNLVSNPTGAFLPSIQKQVEQRFREVLRRKWGLVFNNLFTFANVPLGRYRRWLRDSGNLDNYLGRLASAFNPCAVEGVMCRTLVAVSWDGHLFDCDFNLAKNLPMGGRRIHVSEMSGPPLPGTPVAVGEHCYTCTAGAGFT